MNLIERVGKDLQENCRDSIIYTLEDNEYDKVTQSLTNNRYDYLDIIIDSRDIEDIDIISADITTKKNVLNTFILASILSSVGVGIEIKDLDFVLEGGLVEIFDSNYKYLFDKILEENPKYNKKRRIHFLLNDDDIEIDIIKFMSFVNDRLIPVAPRIYKRKVKRKEEIL